MGANWECVSFLIAKKELWRLLKFNNFNASNVHPQRLQFFEKQRSVQKAFKRFLVADKGERLKRVLSRDTHLSAVFAILCVLLSAVAVCSLLVADMGDFKAPTW